MNISNPAGLIQWAVATGRIPADDAADWLVKVTGEGAEAYVNLLLDATARDQTIRPT